MSESVIVVVREGDDARRGEMWVLQAPQEAATLVESLLEAGLEEDRIRVFAGGEMQMRVTLKPLVSLLGDAGPNEELKDERAQEAHVEEADAGESRDAERPSRQQQEDAYIRNGVRFSSQFRSD